MGASFAGLACAMGLATAGVGVRILERKSDPGKKLHTTGMLVRDLIDDVDWVGEIPSEMTRRIDGVRLYAPDMRSIDLTAPGYYFLATDTPALLRWMVGRSRALGAEVRLGAVYTGSRREGQTIEIAGYGSTDYLVGADGPRSRVALDVGLGKKAGSFCLGWSMNMKV